MDPDRDRFPHSLVWTPIPLLSWLLPCIIGHMGISDSIGRVHDFAGDRGIQVDRMAFGRPAFYAPVPSGMQLPLWDSGIAEGDAIFRSHSHSWLGRNCHHHVAACLNAIKYQEKTNWSALDVWLLFWRNARPAPRRSLLLGYAVPVLCCYTIILLFLYWSIF